jgi:hypothetical protein
MERLIDEEIQIERYKVEPDLYKHTDYEVTEWDRVITQAQLDADKADEEAIRKDATQKAIEFIDSYLVTTVHPEGNMHHIDDREWESVKARLLKEKLAICDEEVIRKDERKKIADKGLQVLRLSHGGTQTGNIERFFRELKEK